MMSEEDYLAHLVRLIIALEEEAESPSIGIQLKHLLGESIIAERNTDFLSVMKFINQYEMAVMETEGEEEFHILVDGLFTPEEIETILEGGADE